MERITVKHFINNYISSNQKIRIVRNYECCFEGEIDELSTKLRCDVMNKPIVMVGAVDNYVCISVRGE